MRDQTYSEIQSFAELPPLLTLHEVAQVLHVSYWTARRLALAGELVLVSVGVGRGTLRITPQSVRDFIDRRAGLRSSTSST